MILYFYFFLSAALLPFLNMIGVDIFGGANSWWIVPLIVIGSFVGLIVLHLSVLGIMLCLVDLEGNPDKFSNLYRRFINVTLPLLWKIGRVNIHTTGAENVPEDERFLLVCNHNHDIDPAVIISELPSAELGFIAKKEIYTIPKFWIVARAMHKLHCLPIDRENNRSAAETVVKAIRLIKDDTVSVGVFPEGYTSLDGRLHEFRNGVFKIACKSACPIVVCTLVGTRAASKRLIKHSSDIYFDIVDVISAEEVMGMNTAEISERVHKAMEVSLENRGATVQEV